MLKVQNIHTYYGQSHILQGVSLRVERGEIVLLSGRNGAGKTTTIRSIMGLVPPKSGEIQFLEEKITGIPVHLISQKRISLVPEGRKIIPGLSVFENLKLATLKNRDKTRSAGLLEQIAQIFPRLKERWTQEGTSLSGGEQQMLAIARALVSDPLLILIDEPSEGLSPIMVEKIAEVLKEIQRKGTTILLVEQNTDMALEISDRCYLMDEGVIKFEGSPEEIKSNEEIQREYLAI
ncbi:MAG: ABC-type branched-chain amino acid transport system, ATPase component [Deltaproteobacteria bacterium]|jgi:branched-chain amino acid transport system ATP-binding protein|nr:ABC-type branched-chain amino acid transport system, ATPase component [Deltaproteobacteria bacterium]